VGRRLVGEGLANELVAEAVTRVRHDEDSRVQRRVEKGERLTFTEPAQRDQAGQVEFAGGDGQLGQAVHRGAVEVDEALTDRLAHGGGERAQSARRRRPRQLEGEERVALGGPLDLLHRGRLERARGSERDEARDLLRLQWAEVEPRRVDVGDEPGKAARGRRRRAPGALREQDQQAATGGSGEELVKDVRRGLVAQVSVFDEQHGRRRRDRQPQRTTHRCDHLMAGERAAQRGRGGGHRRQLGQYRPRALWKRAERTFPVGQELLDGHRQRCVGGTRRYAGGHHHAPAGIPGAPRYVP